MIGGRRWRRAELALMAGAEQVEGVCSGTGNAPGNVCLVTLGLNLFTQGVDPMVDLSDVDAVRRTVQGVTRWVCMRRHPYGGILSIRRFLVRIRTLSVKVSRVGKEGLGRRGSPCRGKAGGRVFTFLLTRKMSDGHKRRLFR